jgi:DNA-binding NtrC family response regulator
MAKCRVLLVDDEPVFLATLSKVLRARDYEVGTVESGAAALEELGRTPWDVVVLDQKMPGMDGLTTLHHIQRSHPTLQVILLTGHAEMDTAVEAMERGAVDYLLKPAAVDKLCERIQAALERKKVLEELERG